MHLRSALLAVAAALCLGCAAGEPLDGPVQDLELAEDGITDQTVIGQVFVDVADETGKSLRADAVWIAVDDFERQPASCMEDHPHFGCETWLADFEAEDELTVWAEICGLSFLESVTPTAQLPEVARGAMHVTVVADDTACAP